MTRTASGTEIVLTAGDYSARIVTVGAGLAALTLRGHDLVIPHDADEVPDGYLGKTLLPWPNRIAGAAYTWEGVRHEVPCNEASTGSALHGLMCWVDWDVAECSQDAVTLWAYVAPRPGYPGALESWVTYRLDVEAGLSVSIRTVNVGKKPAPYGVSAHPYLSIDRLPLDDLHLVSPGTTVLSVDENMAPVARHAVSETGLDLRDGRDMAAMSIDHAFTDLPEGEWAVTLSDPASGASSTLRSDARWMQLYTADSIGRHGVAVEPMTCPPNAFNSGEDVVVLAPGAEHELTFTISGVMSA